LLGSVPLYLMASSIKSARPSFESLLIKIPFLSTVTSALPITSFIRLAMIPGRSGAGIFLRDGSGAGISTPMMLN
jgi:hypothetical protein